jgi:hypothetical protein
VARTGERIYEVVSQYRTTATLATFVNEVLAYKPAAPRYATGKKWFHFNNAIRQTKLEILSCIPEARLSVAARRFVAEERRRFPEERRTRFHGGFVGSPVSRDSLSRGSDEDVLNAFRKFPDETGWDHPRQWMKGGNIQLSREFAEFAKANPERAARIIDKLEPNFGSRAAG